MTPPNRSILTVALVCATMTASCAVSPLTSAVAPPRLTLPAMATRPCDLHRLPEAPTLSDLEIGYMERGRQIAACDIARRLAVDTLMAERAAGEKASRASLR